MTEAEAIFAALDLIEGFPQECVERVYAAMDARGAALRSSAPASHVATPLTDADMQCAAILYLLQLLRGRNYVRPSRRLRDDWTFVEETIH